ncbi:phage tail tip lysozyme [Asaia sp. HumB]|uniref:phage tail tip lysozyme n=1 Tax=Asaia sp. HumB TaxID=3035475 RepID=UPI0025556D31|nr:phage tail tip lysozyme [Asaia sp. HumB]MDL2169775.1 phage tail tip lysozyme [Asaia sp. HumB]
MEKQAQATGSGMERDGVKAASFFSGVRREALAMFAVFTGGKSLKAFVTDTAQANAQLGYMARNLNMDPSQLYRLEAAAKAAGGSFGEVAQTFGSLQQRLTDPKQWAEVTNAFSQLGVTDFLDKKGNINPNLAALLNRGIHAQHLSNAKAIALMNQVNIGAGMQNLGLMSEDEFSKFQAKQNSLSAPSDEDIKNLTALNQSLANLKRENDALATSLAGQLSPELQKVIDQFTKWEQEHPEPAKVIAGIAFAVDELSKSLNGLGSILVGMTGLSILKKLFGGDKKALKAAIDEIKALRAGVVPKTEAALTAGGRYASRLLGVTALTVGEGLSLNSDINDSRRRANQTYDASTHKQEHQSFLYQSLIRAGYSRNAALGVVGNLEQESALNPGATGDRDWAGNPSAFGIAQWHKERADDIQKRFGIDVRTAGYEDQVRALLLELKSGGDAGAKQADAALRDPNISVDRAVKAFREHFERPLNADGKEDEWRLALALKARDSIPEAPAISSQDTPLPIADNSRNDTTVIRYDASKAEQGSAIKRLAESVDAHLRGQKPAVGLDREDIAMLLQRRDQPQSVSPQADAIKAWRDQQVQAVQSIGTGDVSRMAASVTAGSSPGSVSNTTTTNHNASFNGDVVIHTNATDAQGMARDAVPQLRKQLSSNNMSGLQ